MGINTSGGEERMVNWIMYGKIQEQKRNKLNKSQVMRRLSIDYSTVLEYLDMSPDEYARAAEASMNRTKKADNYQDYNPSA
jgi:hypothetical protein